MSENPNFRSIFSGYVIVLFFVLAANIRKSVQKIRHKRQKHPALPAKSVEALLEDHGHGKREGWQREEKARHDLTVAVDKTLEDSVV